MPAGRTETPPKNVEVGMKRYDVVVVGGGHNGLTAVPASSGRSP